MSQADGTLPERPGEGASALRTNIIAVVCGDGGACLMCEKCGHEFLHSKPLSDESEPMTNTALARKLFYHMCALPRRDPYVWRGNGR